MKTVRKGRLRIMRCGGDRALAIEPRELCYLAGLISRKEPGGNYLTRDTRLRSLGWDRVFAAAFAHMSLNHSRQNHWQWNVGWTYLPTHANASDPPGELG